MDGYWKFIWINLFGKHLAISFTDYDKPAPATQYGITYKYPQWLYFNTFLVLVLLHKNV